MAEKRVIEYEAASELANDDWLLIDGVTEGTRKARPNVVMAELGRQVTNIATAVGGLTQITMGHEQSFAPSYDESTSYDVGDLVMKYACLYKCTAPTTGAWDSSKWQLATVAEQLEESGKIDDVQVNGVSVVTDKVASIDLTGMQADIDSKQADTKIGGTSILDNNKVANLDFLASYGEASGEIASFNDGAAMPLKSLKIGIEAVQAGSGDPSPENIRPISGWSAVNRYVVGENLYNIRESRYMPEANLQKLNSGDTLYVTTNFMSNFALYIRYAGDETATEYTISKKTLTTITLTNTVEAIATSQSVADNITGTGKDVKIYHNGTTYTTTLKDGQGNPMECYGGELENVNGVQTLTNEFGYVDLSTLRTWAFIGTYGTATNVFRAYFSLKNCASSQVYNALCEAYKMVSRDVLRSGADLTIALYKAPNEEYGTIFVNDTNYNDLTAFVASINGVHLKYELATPQQIPQDSLAIATQEGINNLWTDSGEIIECKYVRDNSLVINDLIARVAVLENA